MGWWVCCLLKATFAEVRTGDAVLKEATESSRDAPRK
jgi:hypothetical protein